MKLIRLWEIITGSPHLRMNSDMVRSASRSLSRKTNELEKAIKPYAESDDPLVMFMTDTFNRRQSALGRRSEAGNGT